MAQGINDPNQRIAALAKIAREEEKYNSRVKDGLDAANLKAKIQKETADATEAARDAEKQTAEDNVSRLEALVKSEKDVIQARLASIKEEGEARISLMQRALEDQTEIDDARVAAAQAEYDRAQKAAAVQARADADRIKAAQDAYDQAQKTEAATERSEADALRSKQDQLATATTEEETRKAGEAEQLRIAGEALKVAQQQAQAQSEMDASRLKAIQEQLDTARTAQQEEKDANDNIREIRATQYADAVAAQEAEQTADAARLKDAQEKLDLAQAKADIQKQEDEDAALAAQATLKSAQDALKTVQDRDKAEVDAVTKRNALLDKQITADQSSIDLLQRESDLAQRQVDVAQERLDKEEKRVHTETDGVIAAEKIRAEGLAARVATEQAALDKETDAVNKRLEHAQNEYNLRKSILDEEGEKALRPFDGRVEAAQKQVDLAQATVDKYALVKQSADDALTDAQNSATQYRDIADLAQTKLGLEQQSYDLVKQQRDMIKELFGEGVLKDNGSMSAIGSLLDDILTKGKDLINNVFGKGWTDNIINPVKELPGKVGTSVKDWLQHLQNLKDGTTTKFDGIKSDVTNSSGSFQATWGDNGLVRKAFADTKKDVVGNSPGGTMGELGEKLNTKYAEWKSAALLSSGPLQQTAGKDGVIATSFLNAKKAVVDQGGTMDLFKSGLDTSFTGMKTQADGANSPLSLFTNLISTKFLAAKDRVITGPQAMTVQLESGLEAGFLKMKADLVDGSNGSVRIFADSIVASFTNAKESIVTPQSNKTGFAGLGTGLAAVIDSSKTQLVGDDGTKGSVGTLVGKIKDGFGRVTPEVVGNEKGEGGIFTSLKQGMSAGFVGLGNDLTKPGDAKGGGGGAVSSATALIAGGFGQLPTLVAGNAKGEGGIFPGLKAGLNAGFTATGNDLLKAADAKCQGGGGVANMVSAISDYFKKHFDLGQPADDANILQHFTSNDNGFQKGLHKKLNNTFSNLLDDEMRKSIDKFGVDLNNKLKTVADMQKAKDGGGTAIGNAIADGIIAALAARAKDLEQAGAKAAQNVVDGGNSPQGADSNSPSKKTKKTGHDLADGYLIAMFARLPDLKAAGARMGDAAASGGVRSRSLSFASINVPAAGEPALASSSSLGSRGYGAVSSVDNRHFTAGVVHVHEGSNGNSLRDQEWQSIFTR